MRTAKRVKCSTSARMAASTRQWFPVYSCSALSRGRSPLLPRSAQTVGLSRHITLCWNAQALITFGQDTSCALAIAWTLNSTCYTAELTGAFSWQVPQAEAERQRLLSAGFSANQTQEVTFRDVRFR